MLCNSSLLSFSVHLRPSLLRLCARVIFCCSCSDCGIAPCPDLCPDLLRMIPPAPHVSRSFCRYTLINAQPVVWQSTFLKDDVCVCKA